MFSTPWTNKYGTDLPCLLWPYMPNSLHEDLSLACRAPPVIALISLLAMATSGHGHMHCTWIMDGCHLWLVWIPNPREDRYVVKLLSIRLLGWLRERPPPAYACALTTSLIHLLCHLLPLHAELLLHPHRPPRGHRRPAGDARDRVLRGGRPRRQHQGRDLLLRRGPAQVQPQVARGGVRAPGHQGSNGAPWPVMGHYIYRSIDLFGSLHCIAFLRMCRAILQWSP